MSLSLGVLLADDYTAAELMQLGSLAEELGYDSFWYVDVRFSRECYIGLAAVATRTSRIKLGTGVTDPYSRHPAITAATIATLDELSEGRAILGMGLGGTGFKQLGIEKILPVAALRESIGAIRQLWHGETVSLQGKVVKLDAGRLTFKPVRTDVPIYIATQGEQVSRLAGELADGVLVANTATGTALDFYVHQIMSGATKAGRPPGSIDINLRWEVSISKNEQEAVRIMRRRMAQRMINSYPNWHFLKTLGVEAPAEFAAIAAKRDPALLDAAIEALPMEVVDASMLAGSPERVASLISRLLRPEVTGVTIRPHPCPGTSVADMMRSFVTDVMPLVERHRRAAA
jgi:5,10-methylenetetrahydromethanopterin reductase